MSKLKNKKSLYWGGVKNTSILHLKKSLKESLKSKNKVGKKKKGLEISAKQYGTIAEQPGWENYFEYKYGMKWIYGLHPPALFAKQGTAAKAALTAAALTTPMGPIMATWNLYDLDGGDWYKDDGMKFSYNKSTTEWTSDTIDEAIEDLESIKAELRSKGIYGDYDEEGDDGYDEDEDVDEDEEEQEDDLIDLKLTIDKVISNKKIKVTPFTLPSGYKFVNETTSNPFTDFEVNYTSSIYSSLPQFGSLREEIESIDGTVITLKNTYTTIKNESFENFFIQYPRDSKEDLSKLLHLGGDNQSLITNFKVDRVKYPNYPNSVVFKLYEPLSNEINERDFCYVVREMATPIEEKVRLVPFAEEEIDATVLIPPEFGDTNSPIGVGATGYKNYNQILTSDGYISESIEDEILSGSISANINVDHSNWNNFVHFGSIEKRLKNFKYKLELIEAYTDNSSSLSGNLSSSGYLQLSDGSYNPPTSSVSGSINQIKFWNSKKRDVINSFDKFENYMYYQSSSYVTSSIGEFFNNAWPKKYSSARTVGSSSFLNPYELYRISESAATDWYDSQIISASLYDYNNVNRLQNNLPMFVQEDSENTTFLNFVDMIGHYFDNIWTYIKAITDVHDKREKLTEGISKDLLHDVAKSLGWEVFDGKDLVSLPRYLFGTNVSGSERIQYSSLSDKDISREIWSRIVNNMPYFLKTKGSVRAIRGLLNCYGIPSSMLRVMEYGGPDLPGKAATYEITRKFTKAVNFFGAGSNGYITSSAWSTVTQGDGATNRYPDTVEFRFKAVTGSNQVLARRGTNWAIRLKDNNLPDDYGTVSFMLSGSGGYKEISSSAMPVYDGDFYSVMVNRISASGNYLSSDVPSQDVVYNLYAKKYDAGRSKIIRESTTSLIVCGSNAGSQSYNGNWTGSANTIQIGWEETNFGSTLSGSMMEYRHWTSPLTETAFDNHVAAPKAFNGNHPSASWTDLITRYSFDDDKNLNTETSIRDTTADQSFTSSATAVGYSSGNNHFSSVIDEQKMKVPNLGPNRRTATKIRIEADTIDDLTMVTPKLSYTERITTPAYDDQPIDSNKLGVFFSPSAVIDEDIILSFPDLDFNQYIGDPRDKYEDSYSGLRTARNLYWQKYSGPNNFWDYLRLLKYYDSSLYKQVKKLVPARANANLGILIEPTILEREKIPFGKPPSFESAHYKKNIVLAGFDDPIVSESATYPNYEFSLNTSDPYSVNQYTKETGSLPSITSDYPIYNTRFNTTNPFEVNPYTKETGSLFSLSGSHDDINYEMVYNLHRPFGTNQHTKQTGSLITLTTNYLYYEAPSETFSQVMYNTGSFVLRDRLITPALYKLNNIDESGWYGYDFSGSVITYGGVEEIFEEVVQPKIEYNITSKHNQEVMYFYSSSLSASLHYAYSWSFFDSTYDNEWDDTTALNRLFFEGCIQDNTTTVADTTGTYDINTPPWEITLVSPTQLTTTDGTATYLEAEDV